MKNILSGLLFMVAIGCGGSGEKEYKIQIRSLMTDQPAAPEINPSVSDQGIWIEMKWKARKAVKAKATLSDGSGNRVWNQELPDFFEGPEVSSSWSNGPFSDSIKTVLGYHFTGGDKPGTWRFTLQFEDREVINHIFEVAPSRKDPDAYVDADCFLPDGKINLSNFYQLSLNEITWLKESQRAWSWRDLKYEVQKRVTKCVAPEFNLQNIDDWETWFQKLSGRRIRQSNPSVHARIEEVMPVYPEEFLFVNPDFVVWFSENMVPNPQVEQMNGWVFQNIYDRAGKIIARDLALTYLYYLSLPNESLDAQVQYAEMAARKYLNKEEERVMERNDLVDTFGPLMTWHESAANNWVSTTIGKEEDGQALFTFKPGDMGFWLRRGIDGSANELWLALREVLKKYDKTWYDLYIDPHWAP